jgi:hypothetical protein
VSGLDRFIADAHAVALDPGDVHGADQSAAALHELFASDGVDLRSEAQRRAVLSGVLYAKTVAEGLGADECPGCVLHGLAVVLARTFGKEARR